MADEFRVEDHTDEALDAIRDGMVRGIENVADDILDKARRKVPVRTGNLMNSLQRDPPRITRTHASIRFGAYAPYAVNVEYGTGLFTERPGAQKSRIYPRNSKALAWTEHGVPRPGSNDGAAWRRLQREGKATVVSSIKGQKPQPYLRPSIREVVSSKRGGRLMARGLREELAKRLKRTR